jgi:hypothetical protein
MVVKKEDTQFSHFGQKWENMGKSGKNQTVKTPCNVRAHTQVCPYGCKKTFFIRTGRRYGRHQRRTFESVLNKSRSAIFLRIIFSFRTDRQDNPIRFQLFFCVPILKFANPQPADNNPFGRIHP